MTLSNSVGFVGKYVNHAKPGDTIRTAFTVSSSGGGKIVVQDVTKGTSFVASLNIVRHHHHLRVLATVPRRAHGSVLPCLVGRHQGQR